MSPENRKTIQKKLLEDKYIAIQPLPSLPPPPSGPQKKFWAAEFHVEIPLDLVLGKLQKTLSYL